MWQNHTHHQLQLAHKKFKTEYEPISRITKFKHLGKVIEDYTSEKEAVRYCLLINWCDNKKKTHFKKILVRN